MKNYFVSIIFILFLAITTNAQTVTWADDIACIVYTHCGRCHNNDNSLAAFPLITYQQMFGQRTAMKIYTQNMNMPPYLPQTNNIQYAEEKNLTDQEVALIKDWVNGGAVKGDSTHAPTPPTYNIPTSQLASPNVSVKIPTYVVPNVLVNFRQVFTVTPPLLSAKNIEAIEVVPGNPSAVYAVYVYADTSSIPLQLDNADVALGYTNFGGIGSSTAKPIYGWVPGNEPFYFPSGFGLHIDSASRYIVQVEYAEDAGGKTDSTRLNIRYNTNPVRQFNSIPLLSHTNNLVNGPLFIPANTTKTFQETFTLTSDVTLLSISPMLHHICTNFNVYAVSPTNDTTTIIEVDNWGAVWSQGVYTFQHPIHIVAGSTLHAIAQFDNTFNNANYPNNALQNVSVGSGKSDEEMIFYFETTPYQNGDELITTDSIAHLKHYLNCTTVNVVGIKSLNSFDIDFKIAPNPATTSINIEANLTNKPTEIKIMNLLGETVLQTQTNNNLTLVNISTLSSGIYIVQLNSTNKSINKKLIIN